MKPLRVSPKAANQPVTLCPPQASQCQPRQHAWSILLSAASVPLLSGTPSASAFEGAFMPAAAGIPQAMPTLMHASEDVAFFSFSPAPPAPNLNPLSPDVLIPRAPRPDAPQPPETAVPPKTTSTPPPVPKRNEPCKVQPMPIDPKTPPPCYLTAPTPGRPQQGRMPASTASCSQPPAPSPVTVWLPTVQTAAAAVVQPSFQLAALPASPFADFLGAARVQSSFLSASSSTAPVPPPAPPTSFAASPLAPDFEFPPLGALQPLQYEKYKMDNGALVFLVPDHSTPMVQGLLMMPGGQNASPADKVGLATVAATVQRTGGSEAVERSELDARLEQIAAGISSSATPLSTRLSFESLSADFEEVLALTADVLRRPAVPQDDLDLFKSQAMNIIQHQNDDKSSVANRKLRQLMYGEDSIYARRATEATINNITREDVKAWLREWQRPDTARIVILGDFDEAEMKSALERSLGSWTAPSSAPRMLPQQAIPEFVPAPGTVYFVDKPGVAQAAVAMAEPGVSLADPDSYALDVLASSLNGFGGKLFDEVRSQEGLAYSVTAGWDTPVDHKGLFVASGATASPSKLVLTIQDVLERTLRDGLTDTEVQREKDERANTFVFSFQDKGEQANRLAVFSILGLPEDFLYQYQEGIGSVTPQSVASAAQRHLHPKELLTVIVGDAATFKPELKALGLRVIDAEIRV